MPVTLSYGDGPEQVGDLHLPDGAGPFPGVVLWHGGAFEAAHGREQMDPLARELARRGLAAYNATYRRLDCGGGVPETFDDALAAVDALAGSDRVSAPPAGVGFSAGAPLALHAALEGRLSRVVDIAGVALLTESARADSSVVRLFGARPEDAPELYARFDPGARLPLGVECLVVHGDADELVPVEMSAEFARRAGCELVRASGAGHFDLHEADAPGELFAFLGVPR